MKSSRWSKALALAIFLQVVSCATGNASEAPPKVASAIIVKLVALEMGLMNAGEDIIIHVVGSPGMADALSKAVGKSIGKCKLTKVTNSDGLPSTKPTILFITEAANLSEMIEYTRKEKILSVTNRPELVDEGVSLGVGVGDDGKPRILLNITSSEAEGLQWNPAILKIAETIK